VSERFKTSLSFDDVLLEPKYSSIESRKEIDISTDLGGLNLSMPIVSSPMDTVTETEMLRAMDSHGGLGIAHRYNHIKDQCSMVKGSKRRNPSAVNVGAAIGVSGDYIEYQRKISYEPWCKTSQSNHWSKVRLEHFEQIFK